MEPETPKSAAAASEIPKAYEPGAVEAHWQAFWEEKQIHLADPASPKPGYSIVIPPPNVTGVLTLGHVLNNTIQDILARRARMRGYEVLWLPGTDHAGIATQTVVERKLRKEEKIHRRDLGREAFLEKVWQWKKHHGGIIINQLRKLGCSCDWSRERFTMDADYSAEVQKVFVDLYKKGLIYRGKRMVNWCPGSQTALSDEEVEMKAQKGQLYYFTVEVEGEPGTTLTIATTRPETIPGDTAVAVNPKDARYAALIGRKVVRPFPIEAPRAERLIPIVGDEHVDFEFGTGVLKVTPAHDKADFEIGARHKLPAIDIMNPDGTMNALAGQDLAGLERFKAREKAVELLTESGALLKTEPHENNVGFSERAQVPIEPRLSEQWFLKYPQVPRSLAAVCGPANEEDQIHFRPERWKQTYSHWLENIQDWCISRQLWWGHRIPAWYHAEQGIYVGLDAPAGEGWRQDEDVLDTWFSSWLWPFAAMDAATKAKFYPTNDLVTGPDIIFFWVARMIMAGFEYEGRRPFENVYFTGLIRDLSGRKMSKSLGNSPDPLDLIAKYGADGIRFGLMRIAPNGQDIRFDEKQVEEGRNFANKLWNAARFRQMQGAGAAHDSTARPERLSIYSVDLLAKLDAATRRIEEAYAAYRFNDVAQTLYEFFWSNFCDWYLEVVKGELMGTDAAAKASVLWVIDETFFRLLRLLHPFMPHITSELWDRLGFGAAGIITFAATPAADAISSGVEVEKAQRETAALYEAVGKARNLKAEYKVPNNKRPDFILKPGGGAVLPDLEIFARLAAAGKITCEPDYTAEKGVARALTAVGEIYLPLEGLVDPAAEAQRIAREIEKLEKDLKATQAKLSNANFVSGAPLEVVEEHRARIPVFEAKLAQLRAMQSDLPS